MNIPLQPTTNVIRIRLDLARYQLQAINAAIDANPDGYDLPLSMHITNALAEIHAALEYLMDTDENNQRPQQTME